MAETDVMQLEGTELEFEFAKAMDYGVVSLTGQVFGIRSADLKKLFIIGAEADKEYVEYVSFEDEFASVLLEKGQVLGAELQVRNGVVHCNVKGLETNGKTYTQALMRALILHARNTPQ